jgi:hypothetical protein
MAGNKSSLELRPSNSDSTNMFQYDIKTHLPYRDVMIENKDFYNNSGYVLVADREWVVRVAYEPLVRGFFCPHIRDIPMRV